VLAQKLLFSSSNHGDLSPLLNGYFDTAVGAKREPGSYRRIAKELRVDPQKVLFLSDVAQELDAARAAGMDTVLVVRPGNAAVEATRYKTVHNFDEL
jgi:enolase-phosphatase E1